MSYRSKAFKSQYSLNKTFKPEIGKRKEDKGNHG